MSRTILYRGAVYREADYRLADAVDNNQLVERKARTSTTTLTIMLSNPWERGDDIDVGHAKQAIEEFDRILSRKGLQPIHKSVTDPMSEEALYGFEASYVFDLYRDAVEAQRALQRDFIRIYDDYYRIRYSIK